MLYPSINEIRKKVDSRYTLVILAAKRSRDIIDGMPKLTEADVEKPVSIAANEIAEDLITYRETMQGEFCTGFDKMFEKITKCFCVRQKSWPSCVIIVMQGGLFYEKEHHSEKEQCYLSNSPAKRSIYGERSAQDRDSSFGNGEQ